MSDFKTNETWIDKVIDELVDAHNDIAEMTVSVNELFTLKEIILNNTELDYSGNRLRIENDTAILEYLRAIYPDSYDIKLTSLKEAKESRLKMIEESKSDEEGSNNG